MATAGSTGSAASSEGSAARAAAARAATKRRRRQSEGGDAEGYGEGDTAAYPFGRGDVRGVLKATAAANAQSKAMEPLGGVGKGDGELSGCYGRTGGGGSEGGDDGGSRLSTRRGTLSTRRGDTTLHQAAPTELRC